MGEDAGVGRDAYCREFGIAADHQMVRVPARVLPPPAMMGQSVGFLRW